ncbi:MAG: bifunctional oligoribonuclease/PAP phosphatase NrnA [Peptococcaceae bacterium]|nr:bifunctional oligoribonuclease/PAP phosphatase NrnA [Peptococcaceae bacterium]
MSSLEEIAMLLDNSGSILLSGHVFPDGDCLGSVAALGLALKKKGKEVVMASPGLIPGNFSFLPVIGDFCTEKPAREFFDVMIVLDCSESDRLGNFGRYLNQSANVICIDHHLEPNELGNLNYFDSDAAATGEIVFDLIGLLDVSIDPEIAACLYTAIVTDTGNFRYEKTTAATLRKGAILMEAGIDASGINTLLFEENPLSAVLLMGAAINSIKISPGGSVAWMVVDLSMLARYSAQDGDTDGLINVARTIKGVEISILFREIAPGTYKISFRSKHKADVSLLAAKFGGGGHARASGCTVIGELEEMEAKIIKEALLEVAKVGKE